MTATYVISVFKGGVADNRPAHVEVDWDWLCENLTTHDFVDPGADPEWTKKSQPQFCPSLFEEGATQSNDAVVENSLFVADVDGKTDEEVGDLLDRAGQQGWAYVAYTTWRHPEDPNRLRIVFPLSRPVEAAQWPAFWAAMNKLLGGHCDEQAKALSQAYLVPSAPVGTEDAAASFVTKGDPVDIDEVLFGAPGTDEDSSGPTKITALAFKLFAMDLAKSKNAYRKELGQILKKVVAGEEFAPDGERDNTIFKLSWELASRWPDADPDTIAIHFAPSLQIMDTKETVEEVAEKIGRAQKQVREDRKKAKAAELETLEQRIKDAFNSDRTHPYTEEEAISFQKSRWIIQAGSSIYTLVGDDYKGPHKKDEAQAVLVRDLSPACTLGIDPFTINQRGQLVPKTVTQAVIDYGIVASRVEVDLGAQFTRFDEETKTLIEACCPLRNITPQYHPEIDEWLKVMAKDRYKFLMAWIHFLTALGYPLTALFMVGHKGVGKSLLIQGLSRLWTKLGPTSLEDVLATNFNEDLMRCPLVFGDEYIPKNFKGEVKSAELRKFVQDRHRPLKRKHLPNAVMVGAARVALAANNAEILSTNEHLTNEDIGAITERFLHIPVNPEAEAYLKDVTHEHWVEEDLIAEHALWVRDNYVWVPNGRFLVHADDSELHSRLVATSGARSAVMQFLVGYVLQPDKIDRDNNVSYYIRTRKGALYVNIQAMLEAWSAYVKNERCPTTGRLGRALAAVSENKRYRLKLNRELNKGENDKPNYYKVVTENLVQWAEMNGVATRDEIMKALSVSTEDRLKPSMN